VRKGSVGACGDLAPMSQIALSCWARASVSIRARACPAQGQDLAGSFPRAQGARRARAINGSNLITGIGCLELFDTERWIKQAEIAAA